MDALNEGDHGVAALEYAVRGWAVFPCHSPTANGCTCRSRDCSSPGKHPRVARGLYAATTDQEQIARWWHRWPTANIGLRTGAESGLIVIDIDPPHGGTQSIRALIAAHEPLPRGPVVRTGSGGWHLLFAHPGEAIRNSAGTRLGAGIDVRGDGGYVIAPPSRHASGNKYRWQAEPDALPAVPDWLLGLLRAPERARARELRDPIRVDEALSAWARTALDNEAARVRAAPEGTRNSTLNRAAFNLGQIVGAGIIDAALVARVLADGARATGLGERETLLTIRSGIRAGVERPRRPAPRHDSGAVEPTARDATAHCGLDVADTL